MVGGGAGVGVGVYQCSVDLIMVPAAAATDEDPQLRVFGSLRAPLITRHATMLPQALVRPLCKCRCRSRKGGF